MVCGRWQICPGTLAVWPNLPRRGGGLLHTRNLEEGVLANCRVGPAQVFTGTE